MIYLFGKEICFLFIVVIYKAEPDTSIFVAIPYFVADTSAKEDRQDNKSTIYYVAPSVHLLHLLKKDYYPG